NIGADAVKQKQRRTGPISAANADAQHLPSDIMQADLHLCLQNVSPGSRFKWRIRLAAKFIWRKFRSARAGLYPFAPGRRPAAGLLRRAFEPGLRVGRGRCAGPKARLRVTGRIDQTLDMSAIGEHKGAARAVELGRVVAALPGRDVI